MKPYYQDDFTTIYRGDVREVLPVLAPQLRQLLGGVFIADPPYGETNLEWDRWPAGWLECVLSALMPGGSLWCCGSLRMFMEHAAEFKPWNLAQEVIWQKQNGSSFHNDRFRRVHESVAHLYPATYRWDLVYHNPQFTMDATKRTARRKGRPPHMGHIDGSLYQSEDGGPRLMRSVLYVKSAHGYAINPVQKPVGLILPLLRYSCPPGGVVVDLFAGSHSTSVAARQLGFQSISIEIDKRQIQTSIERLNTPLERLAQEVQIQEAMSL